MRKAAMSPKTEQAVARSVLLGRLREAAEWGNLFDPQSLGKLLEMDLHTGMKPAYGSPRDCGDGSTSTAGIRQDQEDGLRNRRAQYKFAACRGAVERQFCLSHGDFGWEDREALKAMATLVYEKCGTTTTFYLKEPLTGQAPTGIAVANPARTMRMKGLKVSG
jgi:hypothetical protein